MEYWFVGIYILLYLISHIINVIIHNITKSQYKKMLVLLFLILSVLSTLTRQVSFDSARGYSLTNFIFLYLIGAYFKIYPIDKVLILKKVKLNMKKIIFLGSFLFLTILNTMLYFFSKTLAATQSSITQEVGYIISESFLLFCSPIVIVQTVCFFLYFSCLEIKSKVINKIASCVFGIYLIHENPHMYSILYKPLGFFSEKTYSYTILFKMIIVSIGIFIVCWIIEFLRRFLFKFVYNSKISRKNRKWYRNYINPLGIEVNW